MDNLDGTILDNLENWLCENGHCLGVIRQVRISNNGKKVYSQLLKFRNAIDLNAEKPAEVEVDCEIEGKTHVFCNVPGCVDKNGKRTVRTWWMDSKRVATLLSPLYEKARP